MKKVKTAKQIKNEQNKLRALQLEMKTIRYEGQIYYKKKVMNMKTQRLNSLLLCGMDGCKKEFNKKCNMLDHLRTHSGKKPFTCSQCQKSFKQKAQLYKHQSVHSPTEENTTRENDDGFNSQ